MLRASSRVYTSYAAAAVAIYLLLGPLGLGHIPFLPDGLSSRWSGGGGNTRDNGIRSTSPETDKLMGFKLSKIVNFAPGYTVVENLYWHNYSYVFVTDQPWSIPKLDHIANKHVDTRIPLQGHQEVKIYSIRLPPVSPEVKEANQIGHTISLDEAIALFGKAEELQSPMIINNDDNFVSHYYHWIGETFLGAWRTWSNYAWRTGQTLPNIKVVAFPKQYHKSEAPPGSNGANWWEDTPGANRWFTSKFFPGVTYETKPIWEERSASKEYYRIPLALIADRRGGHNGPSNAWKPWGDALRLPVSLDWLVNLRDRVLKDYNGPVNLKRGSKPHVMYLERQGSGRELVPEDHEDLVAAVLQLEEDGLAKVTVKGFSSSIPFQDQVAEISTVDILISVHGNGLTHTLWMNPGGSVFELQPAECTVTDYSPLAIAAGVQHYLVHETSFCVPEECPGRGCPGPRAINRDDIRVTAHVVTDQVRRIIRRMNNRSL
ncbi:uncharacterized protein I303_108090 [Kwoniella dejecticola CBS 10117]|uniref:Glycosyltransferase 61 catalytic domain-containing protein n=1 Tax=Kwoniella dejecticola CBS 10117 TaxID=1296121 RepID=A0A1A5ZWI1_9TREE|nr:uncharacterized protein I303_08081 [Kwoniella dejecticola CBS 10117]OBR82167.1 hypothetical protein I303_08081 [Kwoniella dejecticola CBS 10117]